MAAFLALAPLIMGGAKMISDADREQRQIKKKSLDQIYGNWTGDRGGDVQYADPAGTAAEATASYVGMQQNLEKAQLDKNLQEAQIRALDRGQNPYSIALAFQPAGPVRGYEPPYNQGEAWGETMGNPYAMSRRGYR